MNQPEENQSRSIKDRWENYLFFGGKMPSFFDGKPKVPYPEGFEPEEITCEGFGRRYCLEQGEHSWFNHSQDSFHKYPNISNLPEGFSDD